MAFDLYNQSVGKITTVDDHAAGEQEVLKYQLSAGDYYIKAYDYYNYVYIDDYTVNIEYLDDVTPPVIQYSNLTVDAAAFKVSVPVTDDM